MINYSVTSRPNPRDKDASYKYYASPQVTENVSMADFCRHISDHNSKYNRADIMAVLTQTVDCLREMLLDGKKIMLGDLGAFNIGLSSQGTLTADDFNPAIHVKKVRVNWFPGPDFQNLLGDAEWNLVANRRAQRLLLKAVTNGDSTVDISKDGDEEMNEGV